MVTGLREVGSSQNVGGHMHLRAPSCAKRALCKLKRGTLHTKFVKRGEHVPAVPPHLLCPLLDWLPAVQRTVNGLRHLVNHSSIPTHCSKAASTQLVTSPIF